MSRFVLNPNHLRKEEVTYELRIRNLQPLRTAEESKELLSKSLNVPVVVPEFSPEELAVHHTTSYRRKKLLDEKGVPTQQEVRQQLGSPLAEIFFDSLNEKCRRLMGLEPELTGPEEPLWISPSDALMNKLIFTKPPSHRCVQALQHQAILAIGGDIVKKFQNQLRAEIISTIAEINAACKAEVRNSVRRAIEETRAEEMIKCEESKAQIVEKFMELIVDEIKLMKGYHERQTRIAVQKERAELDRFLESIHIARMDALTVFWRHYYTKQIRHHLNMQEEEFILYIEFIRQLYQTEIMRYQANVEKYILYLECEAEVDKLLSVVVAISEQKKEHQAELQELEENLSTKIGLLENIIKGEMAKVSSCKETTRTQADEITLWKNRVREIVYEFQRYINYVLRAWPGQADFLLSLEKLLELQKIFSEEDETRLKRGLSTVPEGSEEDIELESSETSVSAEVESGEEETVLVELISEMSVLSETDIKKVSSREQKISLFLEDLSKETDSSKPVGLTPSAELRLRQKPNIDRLLELIAPSERVILLDMTSSQLNLLNKELSPTQQKTVGPLPCTKVDEIKSTRSAPGRIQTFGDELVQEEDLVPETQRVLSDWLFPKIEHKEKDQVIQEVSQEKEVELDKRQSTFGAERKSQEEHKILTKHTMEEAALKEDATDVLEALCRSRKPEERKRLGLSFSESPRTKTDTGWAERANAEKKRSGLQEIQKGFLEPKPEDQSENRILSVVKILQKHPSITLVNV